MRFRKKPVVVDAAQLTSSNRYRVVEWMDGNCFISSDGDDPVLKFRTIHGDIAIARFGDWIVKDGKPGTYYPVKPDIFDSTYEPVEDNNEY